MTTAIIILMSVSLVVQLVELGISLDKKFKQRVEAELAIPEKDREP